MVVILINVSDFISRNMSNEPLLLLLSSGGRINLLVFTNWMGKLRLNKLCKNEDVVSQKTLRKETLFAQFPVGNCLKFGLEL